MNEGLIAGIDFGNKMSGTTAVCVGTENAHIISMDQSMKNQDADAFLNALLEKYPVSKIMIDAPLSLPGVYRGLQTYGDYFFRKADKELRAMSPMFLGGLTARAMKLTAVWCEKGIEVIETWPGGLARKFRLQDAGYKGKHTHMRDCLDLLTGSFPFVPKKDLTSWHQFDAMLAYVSGLRFLSGEHECFGDPIEGRICF